MAKIELPGAWADVAEPLRALMAEIDREAHAGGAAPPDLAAVSARWAQVSEAMRRPEHRSDRPVGVALRFAWHPLSAPRRQGGEPRV